MDQDYDIKGAAAQLEQLALDRYNSPHSELQLSRVLTLRSRYKSVAIGTGWRLAHKSVSEEVVGYFQGVIYKEDLPPFVEKISKHSNHTKHLRQSVTIAGLGTPTFEKVVNVILDIHAFMGRGVGINNVQDCGMVTNHNGIELLELSNRYFTSKPTSILVKDEISLSPDVDPNGYLSQAALSAGLYHSAENSVSYFEREGNEDDYKYRSAKPAIFSVGDIVEVQASFAIFPVKGGKFKTAMTLCGITLIDGSFTQARIRNLIKAKPKIVSKVSLKRKAAYQEEELSITNAKMIRMDIDEKQASAYQDDEKNTKGGEGSGVDHGLD